MHYTAQQMKLIERQKTAETGLAVGVHDACIKQHAAVMLWEHLCVLCLQMSKRKADRE